MMILNDSILLKKKNMYITFQGSDKPSPWLRSRLVMGLHHLYWVDSHREPESM